MQFKKKSAGFFLAYLCVMAMFLAGGIGWFVAAMQPEPLVDAVQRPAPRVVEDKVRKRAANEKIAKPDALATYAVSGVVVSADGRPVPGVGVLVKETRLPSAGEPNDDERTVQDGTGALTGADGRFELELWGEARLWVGPQGPEKSVLVTGPTDSLRFELTDPCAVTVAVTDPDGEPLQASVTAAYQDGSSVWRTTPLLPRETDERGRATFAEAPCKRVVVKASADGYVSGRVEIDSTFEQEVAVELVPGVEITVNLVDGDGEPAPEAWATLNHGFSLVSFDAWMKEIAPGVRRAMVPRDPILPRVKVGGAAVDTTYWLSIPRGAREYETTLVVEYTREVAVFCEGLPDDRCGDLSLSCGRVLDIFGLPCSTTEGGDMLCECPQQRAALRGAGQATEVPPDQDVVWLDMQDRAIVSGTVVDEEGVPISRASVTLSHADHMGFSPIVGRARMSTDTAPDGSFVLAGAIEGQSRLYVTTQDPKTDLETSTQLDVDVVADTDLGEIVHPLDRPTAYVKGVVYKANGAPLVGATVWVHNQETQRLLRAGSGGSFEATVMAGTYEVGVPSEGPIPFTIGEGGDVGIRMAAAKQVQVAEGETAEVVLVTPEEDEEADDHGLGIRHDNGSFLVDSVSPNSLAETMGFATGDVVSSVGLGGVETALGTNADPTVDLMLLQVAMASSQQPDTYFVVERNGRSKTLQM